MANLSTARLQRQTFTTSRHLEFCSLKELELQTGHTADQWPRVGLAYASRLDVRVV